MQLISLTGLTLAAACSFSSLNISAAVLALCLGGTGRLALLGERAARCPDRRGARRACSFSSLILSAAVPALGLGGTGRLTLLGACSSWPSAWAFLALGLGGKAASHCLARMSPIALTSVMLAAAAASAFSSSRPYLLSPSAWAALAALHYSARATRFLHRRDTRCHLQLQLHHHLGRLSRPRPGWHRLPRAARRTCSSSP